MASLVLLIFIVLLATTSIGWGPIPGWWKYDTPTVVPPNPDQAPTMSLRPGWLGGAGIRIGDHPFGLDNEKGRDMFALTMRGVQMTLVVILVLAAPVGHDRCACSARSPATSADGSTPCSCASPTSSSSSRCC